MASYKCKKVIYALKKIKFYTIFVARSFFHLCVCCSFLLFSLCRSILYCSIFNYMVIALCVPRSVIRCWEIFYLNECSFFVRLIPFQSIRIYIFYSTIASFTVKLCIFRSVELQSKWNKNEHTYRMRTENPYFSAGIGDIHRMGQM